MKPNRTTGWLLELHAREPVAFGLHCEFYHEQLHSPDNVTQRCGLKAIGDQWHLVPHTRAEAILRILLSKDMAYSLPRLPGDVVSDITNDFFSRFSEGARFYTNGMWDVDWRSSRHSNTRVGAAWQPVSDATFDGGIVALDTDRAGLLWIEDED